MISGKRVYVKTDVCVQDADSELIFLVQEDKAHMKHNPPEPQLVTEAIAAFQTNNAIRAIKQRVDPLDSQVFPCIVMIGTFPWFYKIKVTTELDQCVQTRMCPATRTIIDCHIPHVPGLPKDGMRPLNNHIHILWCYEGFKQFVFSV